MTAQEYVDAFYASTINRVKDNKTSELTDGEIEDALNRIEMGIRSELSDRISSFQKPVPDWKVRNAVVEANQKWNQCSDILYARFGLRVLTIDHILNLWFMCIEEIM